MDRGTVLAMRDQERMRTEMQLAYRSGNMKKVGGWGQSRWPVTCEHWLPGVCLRGLCRNGGMMRVPCLDRSSVPCSSAATAIIQARELEALSLIHI